MLLPVNKLYGACRVALGIAALNVIAAADANANGFYIRVKGASGVGLATAGDPVRTDDASIAFFNPAGMTLSDRVMAQGGLDIVAIDTRIADRGTTASTPLTGGLPVTIPGRAGEADELIPVPNFYYTRPLSKTLWFGLSVASPFGLGVEYERDWFGRYDSVKSMLKTIDISPTLAWRINPSWSIGGGINVQYADATLTNALPNPLAAGGPSPATDGFAQLKGDSWAFGYNAGILLEPAAGTRIGVHYRSRIKHRLDAEATVAGFTGAMAPLNGTVNAKSDIKLPNIASLGVAHELTPALTLLAQAQWFGWSTFNEIRVRFDNGAPDSVRPQNFRDTYSISFGAEYRASREWTLRAGIRIDPTTVQDAFRNTSVPDTDVTWYGLGASYRASERMQVDVGFVHLDYKKGSINLTTPFYAGTGLDTTATVRGEVTNKVNVLSAALRYYF